MVEGGLAVLGAIFTLLWWLVRQKDAARDKQIEDLKRELREFIDDLYSKHQEDSTKLAALELTVAKNYHDKGEINELMGQFRGWLDERFREVRESIAAIDHDRRQGTRT